MAPSIRTKYNRFFYAGTSNFEQSLDVWEPVAVAAAEEIQERPIPLDEKDGSPSRPLVVLVVGSGWMGHRSIIYTGTSWWNSSGPRTFARLGCVCVCIRHRGAFPLPPDSRILLALLCVVTAAVYMRHGLLLTPAFVLASSTLISLWCLWKLAARGSANLEDMLHDVSHALKWVHENKERTLGHKQHQAPLVFGGYSSGGHIAATLLQRPDILKSRGLGGPEKLCDAVLFVSGVLAVRPSDYSKDDPRWLTDWVLQTAFGDQAGRVPSPVQGDLIPRLPHVLIGCTNEVFGLNWLDIFFSSRAFCHVLQNKGLPVRLIPVKSDHWFILSSQALSKVLARELRWLSVGHANKSWECLVCRQTRCTGCDALCARVVKPNRV